jgi:ABC-type transport system substrate-binding protein
VARVKTGARDIAYGLSAASADGVKGQNAVQISEIQGTGLGYCMMYDDNFRDQPSPLKDANVRKALIMAVDRDSIAKTLYKGYAIVPDEQLADALPGLRPDTKATPYGANSAQQLLQQAGQSVAHAEHLLVELDRAGHPEARRDDHRLLAADRGEGHLQRGATPGVQQIRCPDAGGPA